MTTWLDSRLAGDLRELDDTRSFACDSLQSQYAASPHLVSLIEGFSRLVNPSDDVNDFYDNLFNMMTAKGIGLDIWGDIVQISRVIRSDDGTAITLDDDHYRSLLLYKALANISSSDIATLNQLLQKLTEIDIGNFKGHSYVLESGPMRIRWVFEYFLNDLQFTIFKAAGTLARGAGVGDEFYQTDSEQVFGFKQSGAQAFDQGVFLPVPLIHGTRHGNY